MDIGTKLDLIKCPPTEEILTEEDLKHLLETKDRPEHYIGIEISGMLHLGTLMMIGNKVNDLIKAGFKCKILLADWHSFINNKLGGNWENINKAGKYYKEAFEFYCPGVETVLGSDVYHNNDEYWKDIIRFSKQITLARNLRCVTIMGRSEKEKMDFGQLLYPPIQGVDIKYIGKDLAHGGMDQRKIHVLAREVYPKLKWEKPVALHHHLLAGLSEPPQAADKLEKTIAAKMSKSKPWTAIFIHDTDKEIKEKLNKAWCPEKQVELNPVLEILKYIVFREIDTLIIDRPQKFGGRVEFNSYDELESAYAKGAIHPLDLKKTTTEELSKVLKPIREHFAKKPELLEVYKTIEITR